MKKINLSRANYKVLKLILVLLVTLLLLSLVYFVALPKQKAQAGRAGVIDSYAYTYKTLESYQTKGVTPGTSMVFDKPKEFKSDLSASSAPIADLFHGIGKDNQVIANIMASSLPPTAQAAATNLNDYKNSLSNPADPKYAAAAAPIEKFVTQKLNDLNIKFDGAQALTTVNIKGNAWKFDFTSSSQKDKNPASYPLKQGEAILVIGKNSTYYFFEAAVNANWQSNQTVWRQVINSLKVDQD